MTQPPAPPAAAYSPLGTPHTASFFNRYAPVLLKVCCLCSAPVLLEVCCSRCAAPVLFQGVLGVGGAVT